MRYNLPWYYEKFKRNVDHLYHQIKKKKLFNTAEAVEGPSVAVPRADDEDFMAFFSKTSASETVQSPEDGVPSLGDADFDLISETASQL